MRIQSTLCLLLGLFISGQAYADGSGSEVLKTSYFAFHSDLATNINDALIVDSRSRIDGKPESTHPDAVQACMEELPPSMREGWNLAVDFYARVITEGGWNSRQKFLLRADLAGLDFILDDRGRRFTDQAGHFLAAASPAFEACIWAEQDANNRAWVERVSTKLERHDVEIANRLAEVYQLALGGLPIRVDIVANAPPVGANTIYLVPEGGHILISNTVEDRSALEIVFHESSHTLMAAGKGDPVPTALEDAAEALGVELPRDLWHVVLFYLTGETVKQVLAEAGQPDYIPYMEHEGLWDGSWGQFREAIESSMPAYLAGTVTLEDAAADLLEDFYAD